MTFRQCGRCTSNCTSECARKQANNRGRARSMWTAGLITLEDLCRHYPDCVECSDPRFSANATPTKGTINVLRGTP